ncbi:MAG: hypothetical protein IPH95_18875 [Candidatus Promineofilum sp.]|jgi:O-antigen/teichoic acid export membrane protein|nr:hypothetical protein [Promineifilum sp.]
MKSNHSDAWWGWAMGGAFVLWVATYFLARSMLESTEISTLVRLLFALLPILPFAAFLYLVVKGQRGMDELELRVQVEALAIAFPLSVVFLMVFGLVGQALDLTLERHVWFYLPIFYFAGLSLAWRRYR